MFEDQYPEEEAMRNIESLSEALQNERYLDAEFAERDKGTVLTLVIHHQREVQWPTTLLNDWVDDKYGRLAPSSQGDLAEVCKSEDTSDWIGQKVERKP